MKVITEEYRKLQQELHHNPNYGVASLQFAWIVADKRAGADGILSYYAMEVAKWIKE